jgi:four helix bundle protein
MSKDISIRRFQDLDVWQTARELARGVYRAEKSQPLGRDFPMLNQMKRAAISVSSNIAEGFERGSRKQQIEACYIAKGSAAELLSQTVVSHDVDLLDDAAYGWLSNKCDKCLRQLQAYLNHLRATKSDYPGPKFARPNDKDDGASRV